MAFTKTPRNLAGERFGRLLVIDKLVPVDGSKSKWLCRCTCGTTKGVTAKALVAGLTTSCGCFRKEKSAETIKKIAASRPPKYPPVRQVWTRMWLRCTDINHPRYKDYGGRGIAVCDRWASFANFYADMGDAPEGKSLERINNDAGYSPENCKWATPTEQARNRRPRRKVQ